GQRGLASHFIADAAKDEAAEGAHEHARRKGAEHGKQRSNRVLRREEPTADDRGEIAVDAKVVPFHHIAGDTARMACHCRSGRPRSNIGSWLLAAITVPSCPATLPPALLHRQGSALTPSPRFMTTTSQTRLASSLVTRRADRRLISFRSTVR